MKKLAAIAFLTALASPAYAQDRTSVPVTEYEFTDADHVRGEAPTPVETFITARGRHGRNSLIRPRTTFRPELAKSIESI